MLSISRFSTSTGLGMDSLGEALLNWGFLRAGLQRASDRGAVGPSAPRSGPAAPVSERPSDLRDLRW